MPQVLGKVKSSPTPVKLHLWHLTSPAKITSETGSCLCRSSRMECSFIICGQVKRVSIFVWVNSKYIPTPGRYLICRLYELVHSQILKGVHHCDNSSEWKVPRPERDLLSNWPIYE